MGGSRLTDKVNERIYNLINSISISEDLEKIKLSESHDCKGGILTTSDEINALNIIKTVIAMASKIDNNHIDRIGFKDYKGLFKIIVDDMPSKEICYLILNSRKKIICINKQEFSLEYVSAQSITKYRKLIVDSVARIFG